MGHFLKLLRVRGSRIKEIKKDDADTEGGWNAAITPQITQAARQHFSIRPHPGKTNRPDLNLSNSERTRSAVLKTKHAGGSCNSSRRRSRLIRGQRERCLDISLPINRLRETDVDALISKQISLATEREGRKSTL